MRSLHALAWRNVRDHPLRSILCAFSVGVGVAMVLAADFVSGALLETLLNAGEGDLQVTHGFIVEQFDLMLTLVGYVLIAAAAFLVLNAFAMAVSQRQQQIGALRSLGMTRRQVLRLVLVEALLVGGAGTVAGLALGPLLGRGVVALMERFGGQFLTFGAGSISLPSMAAGVALGLGVTLVSVLLPARRATRISPLAALRPQAGAASTAPSRLLAAAGVVAIALLFGWLAVAPPGETLNAPWNASLAAVLVLTWVASLGLLLPASIQLAGRRARRWLGRRSAIGRLAGDNVTRDRGRVMLNVLTLAIGLATITGLAGFMTFAFNDLLGDSINRMAAEGTWAVFPFDLERGVAGLTEIDELMLPEDAIGAVTETVGDRGGVAAFRFALIPELSFLGESYFTYALEPATLRENPALFRFTEGNWASAMPLMDGGCGALVTPVVARRNGVGLGDTLTISGVRGPLTCTIAGIGVGYVNASIIGSSVADEVGATPPVGLAISPRPGVDVSRLEADLEAIESRGTGVWVTRMSDFADLQREAVDLFAVALSGMLLMAVLVAALGVVNTTMISVHERRWELALLRAVGATRRQVLWVVMGENALMGVVGGLLGVVAGMGSVVIIVTTFGGNSWGVGDLALWPAAGRALRPALLNGVVGVAFAPLVSALAARWPLQALLKGTAAELLHPER